MKYRLRDMKTYTHSNLLEQGYKCTNIVHNRQYRKLINDNIFIILNFEDNRGIFLFIINPIPIHKYTKYITDDTIRRDIEAELKWLIDNDIIYKGLI